MGKIVLFIMLILPTNPLICISQSNEIEKPVKKMISSRDDIIESFARVVQIADTFQFTEGPASDEIGNLYFTDIPASRINIWTTENQLRFYKEPSGRANGLRFDKENNLVVCEGAGRRVISISGNGCETVLADNYNGKKLNSPNDLWIDPEGGIYFTDPRYQGGWIWSEKYGMSDKVVMNHEDMEQQDARGLYYISPDRKSITRVDGKFINPNGVIGTCDGKLLYVSDTEAKQTYVYDILAAGSIANRRVFVPEYSDGLAIDELGNVYLTNGAVKIYTPQGELITEIELPFRSSNVGFGGPDHKTLFITARQGLFAIKMKVKGQ